MSQTRHPSSYNEEMSEVPLALLSYTNIDKYWIISEIRYDSLSVSIRNAHYVRPTCQTAAGFFMGGCRPEKAFASIYQFRLPVVMKTAFYVLSLPCSSLEFYRHCREPASPR